MENGNIMQGSCEQVVTKRRVFEVLREAAHQIVHLESLRTVYRQEQSRFTDGVLQDIRSLQEACKPYPCYELGSDIVVPEWLFV